MLASILIGLDHSRHCAALLEPAIRWARRSGATLVGLTIVDEPGVRAIEPAWPVGGKPGVDPIYYLGYEDRLAQLERKATQLLEGFSARCKEAGVAHVEMKEVGAPHELFERHAQCSDLVMLARGSHFSFTSRDNEGDDTLNRVLKNAPRPLVVVPGMSHPDGPAVIAYDGSFQAARALAAFEATGLGESGQVHLVSVAPSAALATRQLERARQFLHYHKIEAVPVALGSTADPAAVILEQVKKLGAGMLVMGAYGQPTLREFFVGSVTRTLLAESTVPLFLSH
jgi:nucleotide-binding universal stress UspA family protein